MSEAILDIQERPEIDDSIKEYEYVEYQPISGSQLNTSGQITITIENTDDFFYPRHSWLLVEGNLVKNADEQPYVDADVITLTNNAIMYLFTNIRYSLAGMEIENLNHPGFATTMLGLAKYSNDYAKGDGIMHCWYPDTGTTAALNDNAGFNVRQAYVIKSPNPKGSFSFGIPLEHIFGFCEDYDKVMYGMRHTLTMVRSPDDTNAIFKAAATALGKAKLSKISWMMPRVLPNDEMKYKLYKSIESKTNLDVAFRMRQCNVVEIPQATSMSWRLGVRTAPEKPRYVIVGLQTDKSGNQERNAALFDHCNVVNMSVVLNSTKYPPLDANANFSKNQFIQFYKYMKEFTRDYYGMDPLLGGSGVNPINFKDLTPLFVFNVSKQSERLNHGVVDITVDMQFSENVAANTRAFALVISDRRLKLQSDGKKMNVLY